MAEEKKKSPNIDDLVDGFAKANYKSLGEAFKAYDEFTHEHKEDAFFNNIITPAFNKMYDTFSSKVGTDSDTTKMSDIMKDKDKKSKYRKAQIESLKKFFETARPSVLTAIKDIKDEEDIYKTLVGQYDILAGHEPGKGLAALLETYERHGKATLGGLKRVLSTIRDKHGTNIYSKLVDQYANKHLGHYQPHEIGAYLKKEAEKKGYQITEHHKLLNKPLHEHIQLREGLIKGKFPEKMDLEEQYGMIQKKEEKKAA